MQLTSPAAARNLAPIAAALRPLLPAAGVVLEVASGPGQHVAAFAAEFPRLVWQPSDVDPAALASTAAWREAAGLANLRPPLCLDLAEPDWAARAGGAYEAVVAINVCHIAPWAVTVGLLRGAAGLLVPDGLLAIYGPFMHGGVHTAPSNAAFDASLRARDPGWGVRNLDEVAAQARAAGLHARAVHALPSNNVLAEFRRPTEKHT